MRNPAPWRAPDDVDDNNNASKKGSVMLKRNLILALTVAVGAVCGAQGASAQGVFTLSSSSFKD